MSRRFRSIVAWVTLLSLAVSGCQPTQPFFFMEDGDLSHYIDVATEIDYPDVDEPQLAEVAGTLQPLTVKNFENYEFWDLTLEEVVRITLANSDVMRQLGGRVVSQGPENLTRGLVATGNLTTTYDVALSESGYGANTGVPQSGTGVEAALSEFDAQINSSVFWEKNNRPINVTPSPFFTNDFRQDLGRFAAEVNKFSADGTQWFARQNSIYDGNTNPNRALVKDWTTNVEVGFVHPLLQGRGTQYNRIFGPITFEQFNGGLVNQPDGVVLARIRTDQTLADFQGGVRNLLLDVETAYWELYFTYRNLEFTKTARDQARQSWEKDNAAYRSGDQRITERDEAQAREQYYFFRSQVEQAVTDLATAEDRLRYILGLAVADGRLIRPIDQPVSAYVANDWAAAHSEALVRRVEIRKQKWQVKRRELELIGVRNHMLPRLDGVGQYRWVGLGDHLFGDGGGRDFFEPGSSSFDVLTSGRFQEWQLGLQFSMDIGFRRALTAVRHHQLLLARDRKLLQELELEVSHVLADSIRDLDNQHQLMQSHFSRLRAAAEEVASWQSLRDSGFGPPEYDPDRHLNAQRRQFDSSVAYFRALIDYNLALMRVQRNKGSLLDYNGVALAEGPWPQKAHFDALRRARQRDASQYLDYGFTRPDVISRGPVQQGTSPMMSDGYIEGPFIDDPYGNGAEPIPTPMQQQPQRAPEVVPPPQDGSAQLPSREQLDAFFTSTTTASDSVLPAQYVEPDNAPVHDVSQTGTATVDCR